LAQHFFHRLPQSVLLNLYGSSEVAADATCYDTRDYTASLTSIPIGRPIANTQVYLLDQHMQPVPIGVSGEIHIGGDGLARGYFNCPELTAAKFVPNPLNDKPEARLYKTGDQARYLPDGTLEYLGRLDQQVKLRGYRIELGEIEAVLVQHPAVREVVVVVREDSPGDKGLVAYVVLHPEQTATIAELRSHVMKQVPNYMVPGAFVFLETLPLLPNGKVDRKGLPTPDQTSYQLQETFVAPRTPLEETIAGIWGQVLGLERVGIHDNFFMLGGHSLLAIQVIALLHSATQVELPLRSFFETPTVAQLTELLSQLQASGVKADMPALRPISRQAYRVSSA
jgi:acyl carrier protein